ncbi:MAG TPA: hypothetical protein VGE01_06415, partial [Fimbriimonas sp.]
MKTTLVIGLVLLTAATMAAEPLEMDLQPVFDGQSQPNGFMPIAVTVTNRGPGTRGVVSATAGGLTVRYPVDLPSGSKKRITTYPTADYGNQVVFRLQTGRGNLVRPFLHDFGFYEPAARLVAVIGDNSATLAGLKSASDKTAFRDLYTTPQRAPERPVGYTGLSTVALAAGSERLSDEQVEALKLYALTGGTLMFLGDSAQATLGDARWRGLLPADNLATRRVSVSELVVQRAGFPEQADITLVTGDVAPGARRFGNGRTTLSYER